ncbi:MAG: type I pullulanase, partial [Elusimicrobiales bacterium]|nr:type I pullulanase [Elusimicrobiales bacterium]
MNKIPGLIFAGVMAMAFNVHAQEKTAVHYSRLSSDYDGWQLWVWDAQDGRPGFAVEPSGRDAYGVVFELDLSAAGLAGKKTGLLPRKGEWEDKDGPDRFIVAGEDADIFIRQGVPEVFEELPPQTTAFVHARYDGGSFMTVAFNTPVDRAFVLAQDFMLHKRGAGFRPMDVVKSTGYSRYAKLDFGPRFYVAPEAWVSGDFVLSGEIGSRPVAPGAALDYPPFIHQGFLGAETSPQGSRFSVFAPGAERVTALIYRGPRGGHQAEVGLVYKGGGVWEGLSGEDFSGKYYKLGVSRDGGYAEVLDPYAGSVTAHDGRALLHGPLPRPTEGPSFPKEDTVLYEVHIRDLTIDEFSGVKAKGKYLGFAETGTRHPSYPDLKTALDHLEELGVNAVHILPFQDFENQERTGRYDWGYMPVNFNSPEGWYATRTDDDSRRREAKTMIDAIHAKGMKVIMDVVYNHTAETGGKKFNFAGLAGDYFYRMRDDGTFYNGSGCGNEFRSESPMGRRFILDSLKRWVTEYGVDGFRFDLMGLIDLETAELIAAELKELKPSILVYGEPWKAGDSPVDGVKKGSQRGKGYSVFNDDLRDALKGSVFEVSDLGYVQAGNYRDKVMSGIKGAIDDFTDGPLETLNYVSCHDNHTLWDRIDISAENASADEKVRMDKLAQAVVFTSQGIPFLHAGEEFLRTKKGEHNSYNLPDEINRLDWTAKKKHHGVFRFYRDVIAMRKAHPAF